MADDPIRPVSEHNPKPTTPEAPTEYWLLCDCSRCQVSRALLIDLVKLAVREAMSENEDG